MSSLYEYLGLAFDLAVTAYLIQIHRKDCQTINHIKEAPVVDVGPELVSVIDALPDKTLKYAVIRGRISALNDTIESSNGAKGVMKIVTVHEVSGTNKFGVSWETDGRPPLNEMKDSVPFGLKPMPLIGSDGNNNGTWSPTSSSPLIVEIKDPFNSVWENLLLPCSWSFIPTNSSINSAVMGGIGNVRAFGIRKIEKFLPEGTVVTGIGQVVQDAEVPGRLLLQEAIQEDGSSYPYILTSIPFEDLICKLEIKKRMQRILIAGTMSLGIAILCKKLYWRWRRYKIEKLRNIIVNERRSVNVEGLCPCQTCLVCLNNPREVILLDCGHVAICADCLVNLRTCPICRETITSTRKAYIA